MDFFSLYIAMMEKQESIEKLRQNIASELNLIFKNLKLKNNISYGTEYRLRIRKITTDKYLHHFLAGIECFEIWETLDEAEYANSWLIPTFILTDKNYTETYFKLEQEWIANNKRKIIEQKEQAKQLIRPLERL